MLDFVAKHDEDSEAFRQLVKVPLTLAATASSLNRDMKVQIADTVAIDRVKFSTFDCLSVTKLDHKDLDHNQQTAVLNLEPSIVENGVSIPRAPMWGGQGLAFASQPTPFTTDNVACPLTSFLLDLEPFEIELNCLRYFNTSQARLALAKARHTLVMKMTPRSRERIPVATVTLSKESRETLKKYSRMELAKFAKPTSTAPKTRVRIRRHGKKLNRGLQRGVQVNVGRAGLPLHVRYNHATLGGQFR
jgi:hypothetical protein